MFSKCSSDLIELSQDSDCSSKQESTSEAVPNVGVYTGYDIIDLMHQSVWSQRIKVHL